MVCHEYVQREFESEVLKPMTGQDELVCGTWQSPDLYLLPPDDDKECAICLASCGAPNDAFGSEQNWSDRELLCLAQDSVHLLYDAGIELM